MPPDMVETLFTKGRPARARTSRVYGGAGIGLTISQRLVERMGGRLEVESEIGRGSTFRILQPCRVYGLARSAGHS
jgi:signal transduction histidine kinase